MEKLCSMLNQAQSIVQDDSFRFNQPPSTISIIGAPMPMHTISADFAGSLGSPKPTAPTKAKKRSWKKPKDKPKRPLSAYNLFFQHEREKILSSISDNPNVIDDGLTEEIRRRRHRKTHGKIGFADLARSIAEKWKSIDEEQRSFFEKKAETEKARYKKELDAWMKNRKNKGKEKSSSSSKAKGGLSTSTSGSNKSKRASSSSSASSVQSSSTLASMVSMNNARMLQQQLMLQQQAAFMQQKRLEVMLMQQQQAQQMNLMMQSMQQQLQQQQQHPAPILIPATSSSACEPSDESPVPETPFSTEFFDGETTDEDDDDYGAVSTVTTDEETTATLEDELNQFMSDFECDDDDIDDI